MLNPFIFSFRLSGSESLPFNLKIRSFSRGILWILLKLLSICDSDFPHYFANDFMVNIGILSSEDTDWVDVGTWCFLLVPYACVMSHRMNREWERSQFYHWVVVASEGSWRSNVFPFISFLDDFKNISLVENWFQNWF